jgi:hypothetical protein
MSGRFAPPAAGREFLFAESPTSIEEEHAFGVKIDRAAIILELVTTAGEGCKPRTVRVEMAVVIRVS